jgi:hypothetical protein
MDPGENSGLLYDPGRMLALVMASLVGRSSALGSDAGPSLLTRVLCVNGHQELTHLGHEELTHPGGPERVAFTS